MSRTSSQITEAEQSAYAKFCAENGIINDGSADSDANGQFVANYFLQTWNQDITDKNLQAAKEQLLPHLKKHDPEQLALANALAKFSVDEQKIAMDWVPPRGLKITNRAVVAILSWISGHGFQLSKETMALAVGQQRVQPFLEWEYVSQDNTKHHKHADDGTSFVTEGLTKQKDGSFGKSPRDYAREREEALAKNRPQESTPASAIQAEAEREANNIAGRTHSQTDQLRKLFVTKPGQGIDWVETLSARKRMQAVFDNRAAVAVRH
jgi:hypothetical protein